LTSLSAHAGPFSPERETKKKSYGASIRESLLSGEKGPVARRVERFFE
jgi:hypothetical protein